MVTVLAMIAMLVMPALAVPIVGPPTAPAIDEVGDIMRILNFIINIIFTLLMIVAIGFILFAAFKYLTAMGDPAKVGEAHKALLSAAIAIAVALVSRGVQALVANILAAP